MGQEPHIAMFAPSLDRPRPYPRHKASENGTRCIRLDSNFFLIKTAPGSCELELAGILPSKGVRK
jgi:hypothetical protein